MDEIVCVFTWQRDPLLYLCLEAIRKADAKITTWVCADRGHQNIEFRETCKLFGALPYVISEHRSYGNSYNLLNAMHCASFSSSLLHCIEDDTIIYPGYLDWARTVLSTERYACALGRIPGDIASTWYASPVVSWRADRLREALALVPENYLAATSREEMQKILDAAFPKSKYRFGSAEQDGFFLRVLEQKGWKTAYPPHDFASHIGWWGYNRGNVKGPEGTFEEQIEQCRKFLFDKQKRTELFGQRITEKEMEGMLHCQ